ncbi:S8 family serine peptidase [Gammaproteobacteria bacterium AB-CW1]|uniref:S8 family serine peptidase n=1 Tax=Natronospira elongata TaxID=3110268 RepID=A0AAP6MMJ4_9GAMM|nr:S8 family serine peptidase [Gammaproteobacteria bacterium AB-CW1]
MGGGQNVQFLPHADDSAGYFIRLREEAVPAGEGPGGKTYREHVENFARNVGLDARAHLVGGTPVASAEIMSREKARAIAEREDVLYVEEAGIGRLHAVQANAPWHLDRVSQRTLPLDGEYIYNWSGTDRRIFIIDSGVRASHDEFQDPFDNRVSQLQYDAFGGSGQDCADHGTGVSSMSSGWTKGTAKETEIVNVKVADCFGSVSPSDYVEAANWVADQVDPGDIVNISLGFPHSVTINDATDHIADQGAVVVTSAGNSATDACNQSPASAHKAYTVASSNDQDALSSFSNFGTCVDIVAPGESIEAASASGDSEFFSSVNGTSFAAPLVAGAAALVQDEGIGPDPVTIKDAISQRATQGVLSNLNGTPDRLLYTLDDSAGSAPETPSMTIDFTGCHNGLASYAVTLSENGSTPVESWEGYKREGMGGSYNQIHDSTTPGFNFSVNSENYWEIKARGLNGDGLSNLIGDSGFAPDCTGGGPSPL